MKNNIATIINDITPEKEVSFWMVIDILFSNYKEINSGECKEDITPSTIDELNFDDWFSWN